MPASQGHLRAIIFLYEWRHDAGAAATVQSISSALEESTISTSTSIQFQRRHRRQTSVGTPHTVESSAISDPFELELDQEVAPAVLRRDLVHNFSSPQSSPALSYKCANLVVPSCLVRHQAGYPGIHCQCLLLCLHGKDLVGNPITIEGSLVL